MIGKCINTQLISDFAVTCEKCFGWHTNWIRIQYWTVDHFILFTKGFHIFEHFWLFAAIAVFITTHWLQFDWKPPYGKFYIHSQNSIFLSFYLRTRTRRASSLAAVIHYDFWHSRLDGAIDHIIQSIEAPLKWNRKQSKRAYNNTFFLSISIHLKTCDSFEISTVTGGQDTE